ncbi:hypothetical protein WJX75_004531 [Coccomyxa subellipsoidea]|uniref:Nuclease associated modular domain-containing protein n=1 Tax=Coccomyxa subellipsoidea TaxID=248742 RepID=A0ABR2YPL2_9CHLO
MNSQSLGGPKGAQAPLTFQLTSARHGPTPLGKTRTLKQKDKIGRGDLTNSGTQASSTSLAWPTETETHRQQTECRTSHALAEVADELLTSLRKSRESAVSIRHHKPRRELVQLQQHSLQDGASGKSQSLVATTTSGLLSHEGITSHAVPIRRKRSPWNKGLTVPESTKLKISLAQKRRWRNSPDLRATISARLKGKVAWNKGKKMSLETREKMSLAKQGRHTPRSVRRKMSKSHQGLTHTPETAQLLSERLSGVPKSLEHREAISVAQRRRLMVTGILRAVESVHSAEEASTSYATKPASRGLGGRAGSSSGRMMDSVVLGTYKSELREFRALQEELQPWTAAFRAKNDRKPCLADVESTRIPWLINKYKQYIIMRERLLSDTQSLRTKLEKAIPDPSMRGKEQDASTSSERVNSNTVPTSSGAGFNGRLANLPPNAPLRVRNAISAAMQYRQDKAERSAAAAREAATQVAAKSADRARLAVNGAADALQQPNATAAQACVRQPSEEECKSVESSAAAASTGAKSGSVPVAEGILRGVRSKVAGDARQHISGDDSFVPIAAPSPG